MTLMDPAGATADARLVDSVVASTGLPPEVVEGMMLGDHDLDALCDAVLAQFAQPPKGVMPR